MKVDILLNSDIHLKVDFLVSTIEKHLKTPSQMEVAPWIADWILMVSHGILLFIGIQWFRMVSDGLGQPV